MGYPWSVNWRLSLQDDNKPLFPPESIYNYDTLKVMNKIGRKELAVCNNSEVKRSSQPAKGEDRDSNQCFFHRRLVIRLATFKNSLLECLIKDDSNGKKDATKKYDWLNEEK